MKTNAQRTTFSWTCPGCGHRFTEPVQGAKLGPCPLCTITDPPSTWSGTDRPRTKIGGESPNDRIAGELRTVSGLRGHSGAQIARRLGVDPLWVTRRLSGVTSITIDDLFAICNAIGAYPVDLVAQVALAMPEEHEKALEGADDE